MSVSCTILIEVSVNHTTLAIRQCSGYRRVHRSQHTTTIIRNLRQRRAVYISRAIHRITTIRSRNGEVGRFHTVSVAPRIGDGVDDVGINKRRVTATVRKSTGIFTRCQFHLSTAIRDGWQRRKLNSGNAEHLDGIILTRLECLRINGVDVFPDRVMTRTIGIFVTECHRSCTIVMQDCRTVYIFRNDSSVTCIQDCVGFRTSDIYQTSDKAVTVARHIGHLFRQLDVIGECPRGIITHTILISVSEFLGTAALADCRCDFRAHRIQDMIACILHFR